VGISTVFRVFQFCDPRFPGFLVVWGAVEDGGECAVFGVLEDLVEALLGGRLLGGAGSGLVVGLAALGGFFRGTVHIQCSIYYTRYT
jgi:hypothetical protein